MTQPTRAAATWDDINRTFTPFAGSCLYAIRADTFFHLALRGSDPGRFRVKNILYPWALLRRWRRVPPRHRPGAMGEYLFICDYAAEPGFGTLRPLLRSCGAPATIVVNGKVLAARGPELQSLPDVSVIPSDVCAAVGRAELGALWRRSAADYVLLLDAAPQEIRRDLHASRFILRTLLIRAYFYQRMFEALLASRVPRAIITHNDFTSLSYLAGQAARQAGIPDFTLQHGFPSQEYFPVSASHYLVWGPRFAESMKQRGGARTQFVSTGAPRLDAVAFSSDQQCAARQKLSRAEKLNVLFLSQSHSPVFSAEEHDRVLALVAGLVREPWLHMMVRRHPQESVKKLQRHAGLADATLVPAEVSLAESVLAADVVLSVNSTAMLEAALLATPVVQIALPELGERMGLLRFPLPVADLESARCRLRQLCQPAERQAVIAAQQMLFREWVSHPGEGTGTAWRYIRAITQLSHNETCSPELAVSEGVR